MQIDRPFSPLEVGETDSFVFDFTGRMGTASIVSTTWTCTVSRGQDGTDPTPQARVLGTQIATQITLRSSIDGSFKTQIGAFSIAQIGGAPASMAGSYYVLECAITTNDVPSRTLQFNALVKVVSVGEE